ncbi:LAMI_0D05600g1_1 [Lachancea mirantina]|uniref:Pre-mRNA-splicing factor CWC24 n=1 Tax=Lachancea mirantina TaxID=1230905 RepID=A0A1G4JBW2_9SACH|nr:LAMI_0D05600g1_1 [Lachancea mirantina]
MFKKRTLKAGSDARKRRKVEYDDGEGETVKEKQSGGGTGLFGDLNDDLDEKNGDGGDGADANENGDIGTDEADKDDHYNSRGDTPASGQPTKSEIDPTRKIGSIKTTLLMDYQPDICKDFKQTGYCGYGDSCKFLHSRDDFKTGWKLNQDWKIEQDKDIEVLKKIPFKCVICKQDYKKPIVTACGHYFCEECFMRSAKKTANCAVCGENTHGAARRAKDLDRILKSQSGTI